MLLIRNAPQLVEHFPGFSCRDMKLEVVHIHLLLLLHLLLLVRSTTSLVTIRKCCQLGETLDEWYKCQRPDNERWVQGEQFMGSFINFQSVCIFRWTSQCAEDMFHEFLQKTLPGNLVQPAIEKQQVSCPTRNKREVYLFDTDGFACDKGDEGEEGSGLNIFEGTGDIFDENYGDAYYDDNYGDAYYDHNGTSSANFTASDELVFEDHRDINSSTSPTFDLDSEEYHCLDMVMVGTELAGITVIKCNSVEGHPGHLTKCCPRFVKLT